MKKKLKDIVSNPLFSGSAIMIIGSNSVSFINYLYHLLMGRMLGPVGYGELASIISLIGLIGIIPGSVTLVITKQVSSAKTENDVSNLIIWFKKKIFLVSIIFTLILLFFSPLMASFLNIHNITYFILVAVTFLFSLQSSLNRSILQGLLKFKAMVISILIENSAKLFFSILLVILGFQVGGVMLSLVISSFLGLYVTMHYLKIRHQSTEKVGISPEIKSMLMFTIPVAVQSFATTSLYSSDVILVKHFFSSHDAGIYAALSTLGKIIFFGAGPIGAVMFPMVSRRNAEGQPYKKIFIYSFFATSVLALFILAFYFWIPTIAIKLLYGSAYIESANLLVWFGFFISLFTLSSLLINYSLSLGKTKVVYLPLCAAILQIIMILFFHQTLYVVVFISTIISALLLASLLIYSSYGRRLLL